jgi:tetratricopeptide (TPR) repeat protein
VIEAFESLDLLTKLVDRSLVSVDEASGRYYLLETVRQYSSEHALNAGDSAKLRDQHLDYYLDLLQRAQPHLRGSQQIEWLARLDAEYDNIRLALEWALSQEGRWRDALNISACLNNYWVIRSLYGESLHWIQQLEATRTDWSAASSARLLMLGSMSRFFLGKVDVAKSEEAMRFARESGVDQLLGNALRNLTLELVSAGRGLDAEPYVEEAIGVFRKLNDPTNEAFMHMHIGNGKLARGEIDGAAAHYEQSLALRKRVRDLRGVGASCGAMGYIQEQRGHHEKAVEWYRQALSALAVIGSPWDLGGVLPCLCLELTRAGRYEDAAKVLGCADSHLIKVKAARDIVDSQLYDRWVSHVKAQLGEADYEAAYRAGRAMTLEAAMAMVFPDGLEVPAMGEDEEERV